jgi:hypothetical protein
MIFTGMDRVSWLLWSLFLLDSGVGGQKVMIIQYFLLLRDRKLKRLCTFSSIDFLPSVQPHPWEAHSSIIK